MPRNDKMILTPDWEPKSLAEKRLFQEREHKIIATLKEFEGLRTKPIVDDLSLWVCDNGYVIYFEPYIYGDQKKHSNESRSSIIRISKNRRLGKDNGVLKVTTKIFGKDVSMPHLVAYFFTQQPKGKTFIKPLNDDQFNFSAENIKWTKEDECPRWNTGRDSIFFKFPNQFDKSLKHLVNPEIEIKQQLKSTEVVLSEDIYRYFQAIGVNMKLAISFGLRRLVDWTWCCYSIEHEETKEVMVGFGFMSEVTYQDMILKDMEKVPWLLSKVKTDGKGSLKIKYLGMCGKKSEVVDQVVYFMNDYDRKGWEVVNYDFKLGRIPRRVIIELNEDDYQALNKYFKDNGKPSLQIHLENSVAKVLSKIKNSPSDNVQAD